jgi:hypothetical protein
MTVKLVNVEHVTVKLVNVKRVTVKRVTEEGNVWP